MTTSNIPKRAIKAPKTLSVSALFRAGYLIMVILIAIYMVAQILTS